MKKRNPQKSKTHDDSLDLIERVHDKNAPDFRRVQRVGDIAALPVLGGLHHHYVRV
jgi:hypothetical protein